MGDIPKPAAAALRVVDKLGRFFHLRDVKRHRLREDYECARRGGYFQSAGIELTVKGEDLVSAQGQPDAR